eukprot:m51a1_g2062 hypothetical protein (494) ;mRNA; r:1426776-1428257
MQSEESLAEALPRGTDVDTVLEALMDIASDPPSTVAVPLDPPLSQRPWYASPSSSAEVAVALCEILRCPAVPPELSACKGAVWAHLWARREAWCQLLRSLVLPSLCGSSGSVASNDNNGGHAAGASPGPWLREAALFVALGVHARAGRASPLQGFSATLLRDIFAELLAPQPVVAVFCDGGPEARSLRVVQVRPRSGVAELAAPPLASSARGCARCHLAVRVVAHTSSVVLLAVGLYGLGGRPRTHCTAFYCYDPRAGELYNSFSVLRCASWLDLHCCYDHKSERLAVPTAGGELLLIPVGRAHRAPASVRCGKLPGPPGPCMWSASGRYVYFFGNELLARLDVATGGIETTAQTGTSHLLLTGGASLLLRSESLEDVASLTASLRQMEDQLYDHSRVHLCVSPVTRTPYEVRMAPEVHGRIRGCKGHSIQSDHSYFVEARDHGALWLRCLWTANGKEYRSWQLSSSGGCPWTSAVSVLYTTPKSSLLGIISL